MGVILNEQSFLVLFGKNSIVVQIKFHGHYIEHSCFFGDRGPNMKLNMICGCRLLQQLLHDGRPICLYVKLQRHKVLGDSAHCTHQRNGCEGSCCTGQDSQRRPCLRHRCYIAKPIQRFPIRYCLAGREG